MKKLIIIAMFFCTHLTQAWDQSQDFSSYTTTKSIVDEYLKGKWYERIHLRGYAQFRYNRLMESNPDLVCPQCDRSLGDNNNFFFRRGRLIFFGQVSERVFIYIQPDFASAVGGTEHYFNLRDAYFDLALTDDKEWRIRFGQSKVPFGFENLQSSSNRGPLDRHDAMNSAVANERDIGTYLMYAPTHIRKLFARVTTEHLKGSGDYGMFAFGFYNGQTANQPEQNNGLHRVFRLTYPHEFLNGQILEGSIQAYEGNYFIAGENFYDQRSAASLILYPQPFGFQLEYNVGQGPEYNFTTGDVQVQDLTGGYAMINYSYISEKYGRFFPFIRYFRYNGGKKHEGGRAYRVNEFNIGTEWQPDDGFELTVSYMISDRTTGDRVVDFNHQSGSTLRLQAQFNF